MKLLSSMKIHSGGNTRSFELWEGDLAHLPDAEAVDILVVPAFPYDYTPVQGTLMGALHEAGISVGKLAQDKFIDLRTTCSCWLSHPLDASHPGANFRQILCFEPHFTGKPAEVVGDIFRSLAPFLWSDRVVSQVAMPLVSTGSVGVPAAEMMEALFHAAVKWLEHGLPIQRLKLVQVESSKAYEMKGAFDLLKRQVEQAKNPSPEKRYDVFLSYSHDNQQDMKSIVSQLQALRPDLRLFVDRLELHPGMAWQEKIYRSLDASRRVVTLYSPHYLQSKSCQEEYNLASAIHARSNWEVLFPIYLYTASLPPHMLHWQYEDCREANPRKIASACKLLMEKLDGA